MLEVYPPNVENRAKLGKIANYPSPMLTKDLNPWLGVGLILVFLQIRDNVLFTTISPTFPVSKTQFFNWMFLF